MKKILTMLTVTVAVIVMSVCLVACGGGNGETSSASGTYKYYGAISDGETHYVTESDDVTEDYMVITLNEDGTGSQTITFGSESITTNFTWKIEGSAVTITVDGRDLEGKLEDDLLYLYAQGGINPPTYILKKAE